MARRNVDCHRPGTWGRRLHRLDPDPATAPIVRRIFARRLAGLSTSSIARELNDDGVLCPSGYDRDRNQHRSGEAWTLRTVAEILANPRYTGRQVWNRQRTDNELVGPGPRGSCSRRWNPRSEWAVSRQIVHPPLVSERDFVAAQQVRATPMTRDGERRTYLLTGLMRCGYCDRRMDAHWVNGRAGYRCRHGRTSANPPHHRNRRPLYVREDRAPSSATHQLRIPLDAATAGQLADRLRAANAAIVCTAEMYRQVKADSAETD